MALSLSDSELQKTEKVPLVWFITGCSSGFGKDLALAVLARGDKVIATARRGEERLQNLKKAGAEIRELDVTWKQEKLNTTMNEALAIYGKIDVLVNNAGYSLGGMIEEMDNETIIQNFQTNYLGPLAVTRALLPYFRKEEAGKVLFMGSYGAYLTAPAGGIYNASKAALETSVGSLQAEVKEFKIECCIILAGLFQTKIFSPENFKFEKFEDSPNKISAYGEMTNDAHKWLSKLNGKQEGDSRKAMEAVVDVVRSEGKAKGKPLPFRLPLGEDALKALRLSFQDGLKACDDWEYLSKDGALKAEKIKAETIKAETVHDSFS